MFLARPAQAPVITTWDGVLRVPFAQKDAAKALGALWDNARRVWVVPPKLRSRRADFCQWDADAQTPAVLPPQEQLELKRARITRELAQALYGRQALPQESLAPPVSIHVVPSSQ
jgi:hypothetical protein